MGFEIDIIGTGSSGNAIYIDNCILIDMGLPYKVIGKYLEEAEKILITHRHGDHLNIPALRKINKLKPWKLQNVLHCNQDVANKIKDSELKSFDFKVKQDKIFDSDKDMFEFDINDNHYQVETFLLDHDVQNQGFIITKNNEINLIYATDTSTMKYAPIDRKFDYIFVEGNYDEDRVAEALDSKDTNVQYRAMRNFRHLSIQSFYDYVNKVMKPESHVFQLHESSVFGINSEIVKKRKVEQDESR